MPIPNPRTGERENEFVGRCMSALSGEDRPTQEKLGICYSKWNERTAPQGGETGARATSARSFVVDERRVLASPVRAVEGSPGRVMSYAAIWGDEERMDLYNTWFTRDTEFCLDWYNQRPWLYDHGFNSFVRSAKIGSWKDTGTDDHGLFFLGELDEHFRYKDEVEFLMTLGYLFPSSGTLSHMMSIAEDGWIERWPVCELSSTCAPAEWRIPPQADASSRRLAAAAIRTLKGGLSMPGNVAGALFPGVDIDSEDAVRDASLEAEPIDAAVDEGGNAEPAPGEPDPVDTTDGPVLPDLAFDEPTQVAIQSIDATLQDLFEEVQTLRTVNSELSARIEGLETAQATPVAEQVAHLVDSQHWTDRLFVASRSGRSIRAADIGGEGDEPLAPDNPLLNTLGIVGPATELDPTNVLGSILASQRARTSR